MPEKTEQEMIASIYTTVRDYGPHLSLADLCQDLGVETEHGVGFVAGLVWNMLRDGTLVINEDGHLALNK